MMKFNLLALNPSRKTWMVWLAFLTFIVVLTYVSSIYHTERSVTRHYRNAAISWEQSQSIYLPDSAAQHTNGKRFLYLPQSAILFVPVAQLPVPLGEVLWRILSIGMFAIGLAKLAKFAQSDKNYFPIMTLIAIPMAFSGARNGQMNVIMVALFMIAAACLSEEKWWQASICLILSLALKPVAIVYVLLVGALYTAARKPLLICFVAMLLFPFLTQHPSYVIQQYEHCVGMFIASSDVGSVDPSYPHVFSFLAELGFHPPIIVQNVVRALAAVATLGLGFMVRKRFDGKAASLFIFSLATLYLVLFNPCTEYNSYVILSPVLGYFIAQSLYAECNKIKSVMILLIFAGILFGDDVVKAIAHHHITLLAPFSTMLFAVVVVNYITRPKGFQIVTNSLCNKVAA